MSTYGLDGVLSWTQAHHVASTCARQLPDTYARLDEAAGSILAQPILTLSADPVVDSAAINGYAVCGEGPWRITDEATLRPHQAVRVRTGDPLPAHTDAVLSIAGSAAQHHGDGTVTVAGIDELTRLPDERARPEFGSGISREGEFAPSGALLVPAGRTVTPSILAIAAAAGHDGIEIVRPPVVGVIVLGTSLLSQGQSRGGRVRDALGNVVPAFVAACGGRGNPAVRAPDTADLLLSEIDDAAVDVIITTGSTAPGPDNHVRQVMRDLGAHWLIDGVAVTPGAQMLLAKLPDGRFLVGLPGDPQSALAGLVTLVAPLIAALRGAPPLRSYQSAVLFADTPAPEFAEDTRLAPIRLEMLDAAQVAHPLADAGPAGLSGWAQADAVGVVPPGAGFRGDVVQYIALTSR
ncbi:MAG: molybdopterin molybdenumtransferase MoeA [Candidatus Nanopelagicales bacterium]|nr:molybdopterin molybdenumtransferase MoeA [Candidatus Nanopelagicales bacterium]